MNFYDLIESDRKEYFKILESDFPEFLNDYINSKEMQRLRFVGNCCGINYSKLFEGSKFYSVLEHSVGVALIIWHFTHSKIQTLAGLFHDISTPVFKHSIDFMNGDSENQESTEERTEQIIRNSKEIMNLLNRDNIKVEEVSDYHIYPIADNDIPRLSADRFEYTLSGGIYQVKVFDIEDIKKYYNNVTICKNEDDIVELSFKDIKICEEFIHKISKLWPRWFEDEDRLCMQFIADIMKSINVKKYITVDDLYKYSEREIIEVIKNCDDNYIRKAFENFQNATRDSVYKSDMPNSEIYCTSVKGKKRYINPLVIANDKVNRIKNISVLANSDIDDFINKKVHKFVGFKFDFKPYVTGDGP